MFHNITAKIFSIAMFADMLMASTNDDHHYMAAEMENLVEYYGTDEETIEAINVLLKENGFKAKAKKHVLLRKNIEEILIYVDADEEEVW